MPKEVLSRTEPRRVIDVKHLNKFCEQIKEKKRTCHANMLTRNAEQQNKLDFERSEIQKTEQMWEQLKLKLEAQRHQKKELNENIKMTTDQLTRENEIIFVEYKMIESDIDERNKLLEDNMRDVRQEVYSGAKALLKEEAELKHKYEEEEAIFRANSNKRLRDCQSTWEERIWDILHKLKESHAKVHKDKLEVICLQQKTAEAEEVTARLKEKSVEDEPMRSENNRLRKNLSDLELDRSTMCKNAASLSEKQQKMKTEIAEERKMLGERKAKKEPNTKLRDKLEKSIKCQETELDQLKAQMSKLKERLLITSQDQQKFMQELEHLGNEKFKFKKDLKECMTFIENPEKLRERVKTFHDNFCSCGQAAQPETPGSSQKEVKRGRRREDAVC